MTSVYRSISISTVGAAVHLVPVIPWDLTTPRATQIPVSVSASQELIQAVEHAVIAVMVSITCLTADVRVRH